MAADVKLKEQVTMEKDFKDRIAVLTISYHNLGVEQEFLKQYLQATESYRMAKEFSDKYLGVRDPVTHNMADIYIKAKHDIDKKLEANAIREEAR